MDRPPTVCRLLGAVFSIGTGLADNVIHYLTGQTGNSAPKGRSYRQPEPVYGSMLGDNTSLTPDAIQKGGPFLSLLRTLLHSMGIEKSQEKTIGNEKIPQPVP
jgi:hypothetical protein